MAQSAFNTAVIEEFRTNGGRVSSHGFAGAELLLLTTRGHRTGKPCTTPLMYSVHGDDLIVVASAGGADHNPAWFTNLVANSEVEVEVGTEKFRAQATPVPEAERERIYAEHEKRYPQFGEYRTATARKIPVVRLTRLG